MSDYANIIASVLVVDDEHIVLSLVEDTLTDEGYEITTTLRPSEAIKLTKNQQFDFLLTDIRMPEMNGIELAREIRLINPTVGVIFMTGYANLDTAKQAIKEGAYDYIMKPFELSEIRQAMSRAVGKKKSDASAALSKELNKIADLSRQMYTSGDLASLLGLSLSFAMVQSKAIAGMAIYINSKRNQITVMPQEGNQVGVTEAVDFECSDEDIKTIQQFTEPLHLNSSENYPLRDTKIFQNNQDIFLPQKYFATGGATLVPLYRGGKILGYLTLFNHGTGEKTEGADTQLLNFIASQLAISLENFQLLDESREAYKHLEYLQDQTIQMEKMATRGQMSAEIGHELNNYLGVVMANFQLMDVRLQKGITEGVERFTESINDHLDKISQFTKNLMDHSSGKSAVFKVTDIIPLLNRIVDFLRPQKKFRECDIEISADSDVLEAEIDASLLEQVLYNFLNNAADASSESEIKRIDITATQPNDDLIQISIKDHGCGIPKDRIDKLFKEKFTTKDSGHGIGLVVCKGIIDKHKGSIRVESIQGQGTNFIISLPVNREITYKETATAK
ncbi:MAG: response regulator [candidate division Zixibacteria bacterium]